MPATRRDAPTSRLRPTVVHIRHPYPIQLRRAPRFVRVVGRVVDSGDLTAVYLPHVRRVHIGGLFSTMTLDTYGDVFYVINEHPYAQLPASTLRYLQQYH